MRNLLAVGRRGTKALVLATVLVCCYLEVYTPPEALAASTSDNFARADGPLGPNWTDMTDGGLTIASQVVEGGNSSNTGDMWTAETFGSDQFSEVQTTATPLTGDEWIGPSVRSQDGGASDYVGIYYWNSGSPVLMLFLRLSDAWEQLGATYNSGVLAAGTTLEVMATGTTITFLEDGVPCITASDSSLTGGAPGIMAYGTGEAADWSGGDVEVGAPQSIGGTISGLSGTVVLADNSSDQLSLSANGPFTFASQVPSGSQYQVTVQTNPTGQTCSVANGAGTVGTTGVTDVTVSCVTEGNGSATDNFDRANGPLGPTGPMPLKVALRSHPMRLSGPMPTAPLGISGPLRTTTATSIPRYRSPRRSSAVPSGSVRPCASRTVARRAMSGSTTGTMAARSSRCSIARGARGTRSALPSIAGPAGGHHAETDGRW